ncbi:MAG TPA: hypothetical protein VEH29_12645, partial [Acidimicrobiales bacterium]|nr:hypothetical protein [Acidimicrobiales bacterium]
MIEESCGPEPLISLAGTLVVVVVAVVVAVGVVVVVLAIAGAVVEGAVGAGLGPEMRGWFRGDVVTTEVWGLLTPARVPGRAPADARRGDREIPLRLTARIATARRARASIPNGATRRSVRVRDVGMSNRDGTRPTFSDVPGQGAGLEGGAL